MTLDTTTIEGVLEILAGIVPRSVNIRLDASERKLIVSLGRQVRDNVALTDRQLDLALKKIEKYKTGLEQNLVDVDAVLQEKKLKFPIREIDRTQTISLVKKANKNFIELRYPFSKKLAVLWSEIEPSIIGQVENQKSIKNIPLNEKNVVLVVDTFKDREFTVDTKILEIYEKLSEIGKNPENYIPFVDYIDDQLVLKNFNRNAEIFLSTKIEKDSKTAFLKNISELKTCGVFKKSENLLEKIQSTSCDDLTRSIVLAQSTRIKVDPDQHEIEDLLSSVNLLGQAPILILLEEDKNIFLQLKHLKESLNKIFSDNEITVFFRLNKDHQNHEEFNQFVRDNGLNNYIDQNIKAVIISKNRIPKPLYKADWKPKSALLMANHDYGKVSAYLNDMEHVYYYNRSDFLRFSRIKSFRNVVNV